MIMKLAGSTLKHVAFGFHTLVVKIMTRSGCFLSHFVASEKLKLVFSGLRDLYIFSATGRSFLQRARGGASATVIIIQEVLLRPLSSCIYRTGYRLQYMGQG